MVSTPTELAKARRLAKTAADEQKRAKQAAEESLPKKGTQLRQTQKTDRSPAKQTAQGTTGTPTREPEAKKSKKSKTNGMDIEIALPPAQAKAGEVEDFNPKEAEERNNKPAPYQVSSDNKGGTKVQDSSTLQAAATAASRAVIVRPKPGITVSLRKINGSFGRDVKVVEQPSALFKDLSLIHI